MFINNVAQIALARADEPAPGTSALDAAEAAAAAQKGVLVTIVSAFNFVGRLGAVRPLTGSAAPRRGRFCWRDGVWSCRLRTGC